MDTSGQSELDAGVEEDEGLPRRKWHVSTGRLSLSQVATIERWRERMLEQRPLPGQTRVNLAGAVMYGFDNRPRCSHSDAIAAAVVELLRRPPSAAMVAKYAIAMRELIDAHTQPVSVYLVNETIDVYRGLLDRAAEWSAQVHENALKASRAMEEGTEQEVRDRLYASMVRGAGLSPVHDYKLPAGTIARMAIDAWADRDVDQVAIAAGKYAEEAHLQRHRARRDVRRKR